MRLFILSVYFGLHYVKAQLIYLKFKNRICKSAKVSEDISTAESLESVPDTNTKLL